MTAMTEARKALADVLGRGGLDVRINIPHQVYPPLLVLRTGDTMLSPKENRRVSNTSMDYNLELIVIASTKEDIEKLEDMVEKTILNLEGWRVDSVGPPVYGTIAASQSKYLFCQVFISTNIQLGGSTQ